MTRVIRLKAQKGGLTVDMIYRSVEKQIPGKVSGKEIEDILRTLLVRGVVMVGCRRFKLRAANHRIRT